MPVLWSTVKLLFICAAYETLGGASLCTMIVGIVIASFGKRYSVSRSSVMSTGSDTATIALPCTFWTVAMTSAFPRVRPWIFPGGLFTAMIVGSLLCQVTALADGVW